MVYTLTRASVVLTASIVGVSLIWKPSHCLLSTLKRFWHLPRLHFVNDGLTLSFENLSVSLLHL